MRTRCALSGAVIFYVFIAVSALTQDEIDMFKTSGDTDANSGEIGTVEVTVDGDTVTLKSNGIPDHVAGPFPALGNIRGISAQDYEISFPLNPTTGASTSCLPMGPIGFAKNGIPIYNAYTSNSTDATLLESFDSCQGHPDGSERYHYHQESVCISPDHGTFVGVALDGYSIYSSEETESPDLDDCRGHTVNGTYRYEQTKTFPYTLGCFTGDMSHTPSYSGKTCRFLLEAPTTASSTTETTKARTTRDRTTRDRTTRDRTTRDRTTRERTTRERTTRSRS